MLVLEIVLVHLLLACAYICTWPDDVYTLSSRVCTASRQLGKCTSHSGGTHTWRKIGWSKLEVACRHLPSTHG